MGGWSKFTERANQVLDAKLFEIGGTAVTLTTILTVLLILLVTHVVSRAIRRGLMRVFARRGVTDEGNSQAIVRLVHYAVLLIGVGVALQTAGFNLNALFAAGAVFAIGIGFAMQNVVQNFVAGVILLIERAIKPGDVIAVEDRMVKVTMMGIRATIVRTRDGEHMIVPNGTLVQSTVKNYSLKGSVYRIRAKIGVVYASDMRLVRQTIERTCREIEWRVPDLEPIILMTDFGDNSVNFDASVWTANPWESPRQLSQLNEAIWWALKDVEVVIAFPQLDVHLDPPVVQSLQQLSTATPRN